MPSTFATGYRYSLLGYTTVVEAAVPPLAARHALAELRDTPMIDKAFLILMGNNQVLFELIRESGGAVSPQLRDAVAWWLEATGGYGVKLVNPGGVERWKQGNGNVDSLDDEVPGFEVTPRQILEAIGGAVRRARAAPSRPRPRQQPRRAGQRRHDARDHAHAVRAPGALRPPPVPLLRRQAGRAGRAPGRPSCSTTCRASRDHGRRRPGDVRAGDDDDRRRPVSAVLPRPRRRQVAQPRHRGGDRLRDRAATRYKAEQLRARAAVGDRARAVPARPGPLAGDALHRPPQRRLVPLLSEADPPADGPRVSATSRSAAPTREAIRRTALLDGLDREYTLNEIAIITRAAPARRLGLRDKGHLGIGADADVTIYHDRADREEMFATPRYVIKGGELAVEDGELRRSDDGLLLSQPRRV